ncbi:hypothetical protein pdam_00002181 [Pocillopora damicornis]|uniref:Uncharacterized protein n=1 Tax=Pocillopora damicornis TaxID=46731 RepID=A0A3M6U1N9_POCDA|nr:hypothetical protein pdam_00002181 [Pocillopora damicornis]
MAVNALPKRYVLSGMIFVGFFVMSGLRVNLNVAIGAMVNNHTAVVDGEIICRPPHWLEKRCDLKQKMVQFVNKSHQLEPIRLQGPPVISK